MSVDYGGVRRPPSRSLWLGVSLGGILMAAILVQNWTYHRAVEREQGWVGTGAPCPKLSAADYAARGYRARERTMDYDGVTVARQFGHVMCKDVDTPGALGFITHPVCQFTSPTAIRVRRGGVETFFEPGIGAVATVGLTPAAATCTLAGRFTLFADPTN
jgi:hypothetical protein